MFHHIIPIPYCIYLIFIVAMHAKMLHLKRAFTGLFLSACLVCTVHAQFISPYYRSFHNLQTSFSYADKLVGFQGDKIVQYGNDLYSLDTSAGIFSSFTGYTTTVDDLGIDSSGRLILLGQQSFGYFDGTHWEIHALNMPVSYSLHSLLVDSSGSVYAMSNDSLYWFRNGAWGRYALGFPGWNCTLLPGPRNDCRMFNAQTNGMLTFNGTNLIPLIQFPGTVTSPQYDHWGHLWYSISGTLICRDSLGNDLLFNSNNSPVLSGNTPDFTVDRNTGELWMYNGQELYGYDGLTWSALGAFSVSLSLWNQPGNELWLSGYFGNELRKFAGVDDIRHYPLGGIDLSGFTFHCIKVCSSWGFDERDFIGTDSGLIVISGFGLSANHVNIFNSQNSGLNAQHFLSLDVAPFNPGLSNDTLFLGSDSGLYIANYNSDLQVLQHYTTLNSGLPDDSVTALYVSYNAMTGIRSLWVGTPHGLALFKEGNWTVWDMGNSSLPSNRINKIRGSDLADSILVVSTSQGVALFKGNQITSYTPMNSGLPAPDVRDATYDFEDTGLPTLLCATMGGGMASFDTLHLWSYFNTTVGNLPSDSINFLPSHLLMGEEFPYQLVGTTDTGILAYEWGSHFDFVAGTINNSTGYPVKNAFDHSYIPLECEGGGYINTVLCDAGLVTWYACFGSITNIPGPAHQLSGWIGMHLLHAHWDDLENRPAQLYLYDMNGRCILHEKNAVDNHSMLVPIPDLPAGIYLLRLKQENEEQSTKLLLMK